MARMEHSVIRYNHKVYMGFDYYFLLIDDEQKIVIFCNWTFEICF